MTLGAGASVRRRRNAALLALVAVTAGGLAVHTLLPDTAGSDIAGDAFYASAAYAGIVLLAPQWSPRVVGAVAAAWCVAVELFQLTGIPLTAGAVFPPTMLLLGTVSDARDLVVYLATVTVVASVDAAVRRLSRASDLHAGAQRPTME